MAMDLIEESFILNPDLKAIIMLRNPIDRAWSHAKMELVRDKGRKFEDVPEKEFIDFFQDSYIESCGNYTAIIENWSSMLKAENIFTGIFDDISKSPHELLFKIYNFLVDQAQMQKIIRAFIGDTCCFRELRLDSGYIFLSHVFEDFGGSADGSIRIR